MSTNDPLAADRQQKSRAGKASFIAPDCVLEGELRFTGPVTLAGTIKGNLVSDDQVLIERGAELDGSVRGANVIVHGKVKGDVVADRLVEIWSNADVSGRIYSRSVRVDEGAQLTAELSISAKQPLPAQAATAPAQPKQVPQSSATQARPAAPQAPLSPPTRESGTGGTVPGASYRRKFAPGNDV